TAVKRFLEKTTFSKNLIHPTLLFQHPKILSGILVMKVLDKDTYLKKYGRPREKVEQEIEERFIRWKI
ncbi:MAG: hypothetical protein QW838_07565, partial [Candidatus Nitrosotenuis sp.]